MTQSCIKYICTFLFCFLLSFVFGQQNACQCPEYSGLRKEMDIFLIKESSDKNTAIAISSTLINAPNKVCQARGYEFLAEVALRKREYDSVAVYLNKSTDLLQKTACSGINLLPNYRLWEIYYNFKADYPKALSYCFNALEIAENTDDDTGKALFMNKIATNFIRMQQYDKAKEYSLKSGVLIKKLPPSVKKAFLLDDLASSYNVYHQVAVYQNYVQKTGNAPVDSATQSAMISAFDNILDTVSMYAHEAKNLAKQFGDNRTLLKSYRKLQAVEFNHNNMNRALAYIDSSLALCVRGIHDSDLFMAFGDKADIYFKMKNASLAAQFADSCVFYAQKTGVPLSIANAYLTVSDIAEMGGNWKEAFYALRKVKIIMDSVQNVDRTKVVNELEKKYNQAKNEKTIKELAQEKRIYILLIAVALLTIAAFVFYARQKSLKLNQKIMEAEQRLNRARMNPHFFFNALTSLQSFALRENDGKALASNLSKFSHIMRETLESSYKEYVTIEQEMDFLNEYLEIQKIRFPKKFSYHIEADDDLEIDELMIPSMILQPFVENSIEHGFAGLEHEGHVSVSFKQEQNEVLVEIKDNGRGLTTQKKYVENEHISRASQIIKDRIYLLNLKLKTKARFSIDNQTEEQGVLVKIYLPIISQNESVDN